MNVVFMGTPEIAVPSLAEILSQGHEVLTVYTQPPRRAGRGRSLRKSPVHTFAELMGLRVETPDSFRKPSVIDGLEALRADVACVVAYGQILPRRALDAPAHGCLNLHASPLPRWRGAAPLERAIMAGDTETAVQIMQMAPGLDTGDVLLSETLPIRPDDTAGSLRERAGQVGARMWGPALAALARGALTPTPQAGEPSYAHKIDKREARIDWSRPAPEIARLVRALNPAPGAYCLAGDKRLKVWRAEAVDGPGVAGLLVGDTVHCGEGALRLVEVQPEGKPRMTADSWLNGNTVTRLA